MTTHWTYPGCHGYKILTVIKQKLNFVFWKASKLIKQMPGDDNTCSENS